MRVPRPMICLNSVIDLISLSSTISLQVLQSTPVVISLDVVTMAGYFSLGSIKLSSWALPSALSPVIRIMYLWFAATRSLFSLIRAWRMRSAWSMSTQKTMVLAKGSLSFSHWVTRRATAVVRSSIIRCFSNSSRAKTLSSIKSPSVSVLPLGGRQPSKSLSSPTRITLYGARKPSSMPCFKE